MARNGLRHFRSDDDTQFMSIFVGIGHHFFSIYLDHNESIGARDWDDVVEFHVVDLPPVVSPAKPISLDEEEGVVYNPHVPLSVVYVIEEEVRAREGMRTRSSKSNVKEQEISREREGVKTRSRHKNVREEDDDQDADFNIHDSDYEISDADDDLFANHVDEDEGEVKKHSVHGKGKLEEEEDESESDDLWAPDLEDEKVKIRFKTFRDEYLKDPKFKVGQMFETLEMIRKEIREYSCLQRRAIKMIINDKRRLCAKCADGCPFYLWASYYKSREAWMIKKFNEKHTCSRKFKVSAFTANFVADKYLESFRADQDMNLENFSRVVQKQWHMTRGIDPNDCIFPIAIADVEVEDTTKWTWFLQTLKNDLGIVNTAPWTLMSDKQKGLINVVKDQFLESEHRFCVRHMWQNFQQVFRSDALKNALWTIARSSTIAKYERSMEYMKALNPDAHAWLDKLDPKTWVGAFQSGLPKCDILLNNNCEVFNKYILEAREFPVLSMFDRIKKQMMTRHYSKGKEAGVMTGIITPNIKKKLDKKHRVGKQQLC
ncbi:hypothetical protein ACQ4PT_065853 [Festuca glaucescens]